MVDDMKKMIIIASILAVILLAGCAQSNVGTTGESAGNAPTDAESTESVAATVEPSTEAEPQAETQPQAEIEQPAEIVQPADNTAEAPPADAQQTQVAANTPPTTGADIGEAKAKEIALTHAGLKESDVVFVRVHLDYDDRRREYEVEFYSGNIEYDYDIDAETGEIRSYDRDAEYYTPRGRPATTPPSTGTDIGEAKAKEIALAHAGYSANEVQWLFVERDFDDGRLEYEVEFYVGNIEYSYEIDAASGTVISYEAEQGD
jgi:uncharacterized membrane protein YkoI